MTSKRPTEREADVVSLTGSIPAALAGELAEEEAPQLQSGRPYAIWSPYNAYEGAETLLACLNVLRIEELNDPMPAVQDARP